MIGTRYNHHINTHFAECQLLATAQDTHRKREVKLFAIPNEPTLVGISDGVDSWVTSAASNPFSCKVERTLRKLKP